ncbi:MAG: hydantoinase/oxoprolinase family protein [Rhodobacteraceae bacterium]|nr:hydantoinase/oxoprolinase family protein [Paracoccaceae bacterium]
MANGSYRVAADIGGTFTDIVVQHTGTGQCRAAKVLSTPANPARAVATGIAQALPSDADIDFFVHGTTVGINALLTRRGARVALITTRHFGDIYTIQGNDRKEIFSIRWNKPKPLVPREHTFEIAERISGKGEVVTPLDVTELEQVADAIRDGGFEAVAVCFLFSFLNPEHELATEAFLKRKLPGTRIALSHRVSPEWREFERTSTTVMDSYLSPVVSAYLDELSDLLADRIARGHAIHIMESNGGIMTAASASRAPLQTVLSGPVGGAVGGRELSRSTGIANMICIDMGGTSFDTSLIIDGQPSGSNEAEIIGLPVQLAVVDIHVIGAGGGSIAWTETGALRVGPQSAGSSPGPACYGLGGKLPTVSDANLVLGRLDEGNFSDESIVLDRRLASEALGQLAKRFGMTDHELAQGIVDITNAKMADAIRTITVKRGIDPREFVLVAFGGAGPSQAVALAEQLEIGKVLVPVMPGAFSAWGMLQTDIRHDFKETLYSYLDKADISRLEERFRRLESLGVDHLRSESVGRENLRFTRSADFRYEGQEYVLTIEFPEGPIDVQAVRDRFDAAYLRQYGHNSPESRVEMTNIRLVVIGLISRPKPNMDVALTGAAACSREVHFDGRPCPTKIVDRDSIGDHSVIDGPAIIEEGTATTLVPPDWQARQVDGGHLMLNRRESAP